MPVVLRMSFNVTEDDYNEFWGQFYARIKEASTEKLGLPIIGPVDDTKPWNWAIIGVKTPSYEISLLIRVDNLYLYGWRVGPALTESNNNTFLIVNEKKIKDVPAAYDILPFTGSYENLPSLVKIAVNRATLSRCVASLQVSTAACLHARVKESFVTFILVFCAALRIIEIRLCCSRFLTPSFDNGMCHITQLMVYKEKHWRHASVAFITGTPKKIDGYEIVNEENANEMLSLALWPSGYKFKNLPPVPGWNPQQRRGGSDRWVPRGQRGQHGGQGVDRQDGQHGGQRGVQRGDMQGKRRGQRDDMQDNQMALQHLPRYFAYTTTTDVYNVIGIPSVCCLRPVIQEEDNCRSCLKTGTGNASHRRLKQSEMHHLPTSTKYLALLANNTDGVGFLIKAQLDGFSADVVSEVAAKELEDARLSSHVLTVLHSMQSAPKKSDDEEYVSASEESKTLAELFVVVTHCEKQQFPGEALLKKARMMRWPLLAIIASCFSDTSTLSCAAFWLEITSSRLTLSKTDKIILEMANNVAFSVEHTNRLPPEGYSVKTSFDRQKAKRQWISEPALHDSSPASSSDNSGMQSSNLLMASQENTSSDERKKAEDSLNLFAEIVVLFCEKMFLPLLRELFLPLYPLLCLVRSLQALLQMRLAEASVHLATFSAWTREEPTHTQPALLHDGLLNQVPWLGSTAVKSAEAVLSTCPTLYERRSLLHLLASADFGDDSSSAAYFKRLYWKINLAKPDLKIDWFDKLDDGALFTELVRRGWWEEARSWAWQLEASDASWKSAVHHVTESQAEAMVLEWKEFLWDFPQERAALWGHCQALFVRYSFPPPLLAESFLLKHAEATEKEIPARELHEMLLLSPQWLSGTIGQIPPVYPLHLLREIETRIWRLAVESEIQSSSDHETSPSLVQNLPVSSFIEQTAKVVSKMDSHINATRARRLQISCSPNKQAGSC